MAKEASEVGLPFPFGAAGYRHTFGSSMSFPTFRPRLKCHRTASGTQNSFVCDLVGCQLIRIQDRPSALRCTNANRLKVTSSFGKSNQLLLDNCKGLRARVPTSSRRVLVEHPATLMAATVPSGSGDPVVVVRRTRHRPMSARTIGGSLQE